MQHKRSRAEPCFSRRALCDLEPFGDLLAQTHVFRSRGNKRKGLAAISIPLYFGTQIAAADAVAKADLRSAMTSLHLYFIQNEAFPASSEALLATGFSLSDGVSFPRYSVDTMADGSLTVHTHVQHAASPNAWHANYPKEGTEIEIR